MTLKNYTTSVPVSTTISRIEHALVRAGATAISKTYDADANLEGIMFQLSVNGNPVPVVFKLPAKWRQCYEVLWREIRRPRPETKKRLLDQAQRVAWRLVQDWVEVNVSLIKLDQIDAVEAFLPYVYDPQTDRTLFERLKEGGFKQLSAGGGR